MLRKFSFKLALFFTFALMFSFAFNRTDAFASDTKVVTVTVPKSVDCPSTAISSVLQSYSTSTYDYDDGDYEGTISCTGTSNLTYTSSIVYYGTTIYHYVFDATYSGVVTKIEQSKTVTVVQSYSVIAPLEAGASIQQNIGNSAYNYDDGSYSGTLSFVSLSNWTQTYSYTYYNLVFYHFTYDVTYSGTVTHY